MNCKKIVSITALSVASLIWGLAFSAQRSAMEQLSPLVFMTLRSLIGSVAIASIILLNNIIRKKKRPETPAENKKSLIYGGFFCGIFLAVAGLLQQYGLCRTTAGKGGFLTALYIVIVPLLGLFFRKKATFHEWIAVFLSLAGSYLLCSPGENESINPGDLMIAGCAIFFAMHIIAVGSFAPDHDTLLLSCIQFITVTVIAATAAVTTGEKWCPANIQAAMLPLLFCGILSSGIAFSLQISAQKNLSPAAASIIMSLESVFAVLGGWLLLNESLSMQEKTGCAIIFAAVILSQLPPKKA